MIVRFYDRDKTLLLEAAVHMAIPSFGQSVDYDIGRKIIKGKVIDVCHKIREERDENVSEWYEIVLEAI